MKKILAIIIAFCTSLFNSVDFQVAGDKQYTADGYYQIDVGESPDYRTFYGSNPTASNLTSCKTTNYSAQGKRVSLDTSVSTVGYWFVNGVNMDEKNLPEEKYYEFTSESYIICPFDATLETDSTSNDGSTMTVICSVDNKSYRLTITGMECWYCDVGRNFSSGTLFQHTSDNQKGHVFKAGNVLGKAKAGTVINVCAIVNGRASSKAISVKQMYQLVSAS